MPRRFSIPMIHEPCQAPFLVTYRESLKKPSQIGWVRLHCFSLTQPTSGRAENTTTKCDQIFTKPGKVSLVILCTSSVTSKNEDVTRRNSYLAHFGIATLSVLTVERWFYHQNFRRFLSVTRPWRFSSPHSAKAVTDLLRRPSHKNFMPCLTAWSDSHFPS